MINTKIYDTRHPEIWNSMKRPNLGIKGIEEGKESQQFSKKITEEISPNLKKEVPKGGTRILQATKYIGSEKNVPLLYINQNIEHKYKDAY